MPDEPTPRPSLPLHLLAGLFLLACFAAQCLYVASHAPLSDEERTYASPGPQFVGRDFEKPRDIYHSPLVYHIAQFPVRHGTVPWYDFLGALYPHRWLLRLPFVIFGILFGFSLWYVARRQFGQVAGLFALALYAFSPQMTGQGSHIRADVLAAWGVFGVVYLAIASAHTLYAAPGTLTWHDRSRRPILMGIALGIAVAAQFAAWISFPLAIAFLLYLVPGRRRHATVMLSGATVVACISFFAVYRFDLSTMWHDVAHYLPTASRVSQFGDYFDREPFPRNDCGLFAMTIAGLLFWLTSRRSRWFANTTALLTFLAAALLAPTSYSPEMPYLLWSPALAFLFMFLSGIFADAIDTRHRKLALGVSLTLLLIHIGFGLARTLMA